MGIKSPFGLLNTFLFKVYLLPIFFYLKARLIGCHRGLFCCCEDRRFILGNKSDYLKKHQKKGPQDQAIEGSMIAYELRKIVRSYFPNFHTMLNAIVDHRKRKDYRADELLSAAIS